MLFYWTTVLGKRCLFVLGSIIPRAGMPVEQRDTCTVSIHLRVCNAPCKILRAFKQRLLGDVGETLGEDHERCHSVFSWPRPNSCRATILMLPNGDWRSADRPACAALAGQLADAQKIVTILDIYHHASIGQRGRGFAFNITDGAKTPRISRRLAVPHAILCQAAGFVVARALSWIASTAAKAVMFRMPRTVALCVRM
jgi:hypothetical protein